MKILSPKMHGILDYLLVVFLLASPTLFHMEGNLCLITYVIGAVHLGLTILTDFEPGLIKVIPFRIHGLIELVVSVLLAGLAYWFYTQPTDQQNELGFYFYGALAIVVLLVFLVTDFKGTASRI